MCASTGQAPHNEAPPHLRRGPQPRRRAARSWTPPRSSPASPTGRSRSCRRCAAGPSSTCSSRTRPAPGSPSRRRPIACRPTSSTSRPRAPRVPRARAQGHRTDPGGDGRRRRRHPPPRLRRPPPAGHLRLDPRHRRQRRRRRPRTHPGAARRLHPAPPARRRRRLGRTSQAGITIVGDILHSRVARSNVLLLTPWAPRSPWSPRRPCCPSASRPGPARSRTTSTPCCRSPTR